MRPEQTVNEMSEAVLSRQVRAMVAQTGQPCESALEAICSTEAGQQLRELADGEHRHKKAQDWQVSMLSERGEGRRMHLNWSDAFSLIARTKLGPCQVRSKTEHPCPHQAVMKILSIPFCEACAREQEAYFAIGQAHDEAARVSVRP